MSYDVSIELRGNSSTGHGTLHVLTILSRHDKVENLLEVMGYSVYVSRPVNLESSGNFYIEVDKDISKLENIIETIKMLGVSMEVKYHYGTESRKEVYGAAEQAVHT